MAQNKEVSQALSEAIAKPIIAQRERIREYGSPSSEELDTILFDLEIEITHSAHRALNLKWPI